MDLLKTEPSLAGEGSFVHKMLTIKFNIVLDFGHR
jgi:hypothetical protein